MEKHNPIFQAKPISGIRSIEQIRKTFDTTLIAYHIQFLCYVIQMTLLNLADWYPSPLLLARSFVCPWWRHQMKTFSALLAICSATGPRWIPRTQRSVIRNFDVFFDLRRNKLLSKQSWGLSFETPSHPLRRHRNAMAEYTIAIWSYSLVGTLHHTISMGSHRYFHDQNHQCYCKYISIIKSMNICPLLRPD